MGISTIFNSIMHRLGRHPVLLASEEKSLIEELWEYFEGKYLSVDLGRYEHISVGTGSVVTLRNLILGICAGFVIAAGMAAYHKNTWGGFVRKVIKTESLSADTAKTLSELGYEKSYAIKREMKRYSALSKVVKCVERETFEKDTEEKRQAYIQERGSDEGFVAPKFVMDFETAHFYIPDEEHYRAEVRFENKGSGWRSFILVLIVSIILAVAVCFLLPDILQMIDNMIGILKSE